jgi:hypothetical protein
MKLLPEAPAWPSSRLAALTEAADRHDRPISARAGMLVLLVLLSRSTRLDSYVDVSGAPPGLAASEKTRRWGHRSASADLSGGRSVTLMTSPGMRT